MSLFPIKEFRVTFGDQYRRIQHPQSINNVYPHPDGWIVIEAQDATEARLIAMKAFGGRYSNVYPADEFAEHYYPMGELTRIPYGTQGRAK